MSITCSFYGFMGYGIMQVIFYKVNLGVSPFLQYENLIDKAKIELPLYKVLKVDRTLDIGLICQ